MQPSELIDEAIKGLTAYYGLLDVGQQSVIRALAYTVALAIAIEYSMWTIRHRKPAEEDLIQVVLTQPVRVGQAKEHRANALRAVQAQRRKMPVRKTHTPFSETMKVISGKATAAWGHMPHLSFYIPGIRMPTLNLPKRRAKDRPASVVSEKPKIERPDAVEETKPTEEPSETVKENDQPPRGIARNVVAEIDFIKAATADDLAALKRTYGFVYVHSDILRDAVHASEDKGVDGLRIFIPQEADRQHTVYGSIAVAEKTKGAVLSDSANIARICKMRGITCYSSERWRRHIPQETHAWMA